MSCSGVGSVGQNPYQFLQAAQSVTGQQSTSDAAATDDTSAADALLQIQIQDQSQAQAPHRHHGGGKRSGSGDAISDLLSTIEQALQSADSSDDPNKVIEDTVAKLLAGPAAADGTASTDSDGAVAATSQADAKQSFSDVLKSYGVDFQQFRADFLAAVKDAQGGQVNPATALKSFAAGSSVDLTA